MKALEKYDIEIGKLKCEVYHYTYKDSDSFFEAFPESLVDKGTFEAKLHLIKSETMIKLDMHIEGTMVLTCDRSNEPFNYPFATKALQIIQFGEVAEELSDELAVIPKGTSTINVGHYLYEAISLALPMKKLHPKYQQEDESTDEMVYSSKKVQSEQEEVDPRWEILKKFKK
ncbi:MAG: DUF177 domain-containing protein [Thermonemataceae bacterium]